MELGFIREGNRLEWVSDEETSGYAYQIYSCTSGPGVHLYLDVLTLTVF